jgi:hypothetical protein
VVLLSGLLIAMQIQHYVVVHHHDQIALQHREERLAARDLRLRIQVRADAARARLAAQRGQQLPRAGRRLGA